MSLEEIIVKELSERKARLHGLMEVELEELRSEAGGQGGGRESGAVAASSAGK